MKRRDPGRYREKVWYQSLIDTVDDDGSPRQDWIDRFSFMAAIMPTRAWEAIVGDRATAQVALDVLARWRRDFFGGAGRLRVESTGQILSVAGVRDVEQRRVEVVLSCYESKDPVGDR